MLAARLVRFPRTFVPARAIVAVVVAALGASLAVVASAGCGPSAHDANGVRSRETNTRERGDRPADRPAVVERAGPDASVDAGPRFGFTPAAWMQSHGVVALPEVDVCDYETLVGEPPLPVIVCSTHHDHSDDRVVYRRTIYVAERGELRRVFDAAVASGRREPSIDGDGGNDPYNVKLDFSMAADGTITLRDTADRGCSAAAAAKRRDDAADKVCAARGVYVWKEGRFARPVPGSRVDERPK